MAGAVHDLLLAHAESFPFASRAAFDLGVVALGGAGAPRPLADQTATLGRALEDRMRPLAGGLPLAALERIRDAAWFQRDGAPRASVDLAEHLLGVARSYLACDGDRVAVRGQDGFAERAIRFRWLTLLLPADLLVAAAACEHGCEPSDDAVSLATPQVLKVLERPVADTHLHRGAAMSFPVFWTGIVASVGSFSPRPDDLARSGPAPFGGGAAFLRMLLSAALVRAFLGSFLWGRALRGGGFSGFIEDDLPSIAARLGWFAGDARAHTLLRGVVAGVSSGAVVDTPADVLAKLYRRLVGPRRLAERFDEVEPRDPLSDWLVPGPGRALPETRFATQALSYIRGHGASDAAFARCFWQYERVRCIVFRHVTQDPGTSGLDWFSRHFQRISALRTGLQNVLTASALDLQGRGVRLASLEARTSPDRSWADIRGEIRRLAEQALSRPAPRGGRPEIGLVLHFLKERLSSETGKAHADPRDPRFGCRYGRWFVQRQREALAISQLLQFRPDTLFVLRGVDIANTELAIPTWPTIPLFAHAREASARAAHALVRSAPFEAVPPLRVTCHAGEDYSRLVEGLRRMHELVEFGVVGPGDRMGHGIALGDVPERWAPRCHVAVQPREDRLDDLLWELDRYGRGDFPAGPGRLELIHREAQDLAQAIYGPLREAWFLDLGHLAAARRRRHDPATLARLGYPRMLGRPSAARDTVEALVVAHLTDPGVYERGSQLLDVPVTAGETAMLAAAQRWLRGVLGGLEVTLESNPSSNLLIGSHADITEHPAFVLQPLPGHPEPGGGAVLLSINVDDPLTFASRLADEHAFVYFALLRRGVTSQDALLWLDRVRENAYRSRFTLPASADPAVLERLRSRHGG